MEADVSGVCLLKLVKAADVPRTTGLQLMRVPRRLQYDIPVLHLNGEQVMKHRVHLDKLEDLIRKAGEQRPEPSA